MYVRVPVHVCVDVCVKREEERAGWNCQYWWLLWFFCRYYAVCTLNQFTIASTDTALASKLAEIYFTFFKVIVLYTQSYCSHDSLMFCMLYYRDLSIYSI